MKNLCGVRTAAKGRRIRGIMFGVTAANLEHNKIMPMYFEALSNFIGKDRWLKVLFAPSDSGKLKHNRIAPLYCESFSSSEEGYTSVLSFGSIIADKQSVSLFLKASLVVLHVFPNLFIEELSDPNKISTNS